MIGSIFVEFLGHVEEKYGFDTVDQIIEQLDDKLSTGGAYTTVGNYPHDEMLAMAVALCTLGNKSVTEIVHDFAEHLMQVFHDQHGRYFNSDNDVFDFLLSVGDVIHADVRKLYLDARPPTVSGKLNSDGSLELSYESHRPLAELALALTASSGKYFNQSLSVDVIGRSEDDKRITMRVRKKQ